MSPAKQTLSIQGAAVGSVLNAEGMDALTRSSLPFALRSVTSLSEAVSKPSFKKVDASDKENDSLAPSLNDAPAKLRKRSGKAAAVRVPKTKKSKNDAASFLVPVAAPPSMMRFTSSAAFSDMTMPFPSLSMSRSFGPAGLLVGPPSLQTFTSIGPGVSNSLFGTPMPSDYPRRISAGTITQHHNASFNMVTSGDLDVAVTALLNLTPSVNPNKNFSLNNNATGACVEGVYGFDEAEGHTNVANARLMLRAQSLFRDVPLTVSACKCKNTMCLKLYCNCFQTGVFCDELICKCKGCNNTAEHTVPRGMRTRAIYEILGRRINAFEPRLKKKTGVGCSCKKSRYVSFPFPKAPLMSAVDHSQPSTSSVIVLSQVPSKVLRLLRARDGLHEAMLLR